MKPRHVGLLACLGMTVASLTVSSLVPVGRPAIAEAHGSRVAGVAIAAPEVSTRFTSSGTLTVDGRVGRTRLGSGHREELLLLEIRGTDELATSRAAAVNLSLVIDKSGSMRGARMHNAIAGAVGAVRRLRDGDSVSVITFDTRTSLVVPPTTVDASSVENVVDAIRRITPSGDTCLSCGVEQSLRTLDRASGRVNRMLVLSDGEANRGVRDLPGFRALAQRAREDGVAITTVGVGVDYSERVLSTIALESNGHHYFVEDEAALERVFRLEAESLTSTVASGAEAVLELAPGVELDRVFDRSFRRDGRRVVVPLGSFGRGETKTVLVNVRVSSDRSGPAELARIDLGYHDWVTSAEGHGGGVLGAELGEDDASELDPVVRGRLERSQTAAVLKQANTLYAAGRPDEAKRVIEDQQSELGAAKKAAANGPTTERANEVDRDFDRQRAALDDARTGFASPPPSSSDAAGVGAAAMPSPATRAGRAAVKRSEAEATELSY